MESIVNNSLSDCQSALEQLRANKVTCSRLLEASQLFIEAFKQGGKIITCGNGGSMCDAMHLAEELTGRFRENRRPLGAIAISDSSHMSCVSNDFGYEYVFSRFVEGMGRAGDVLVAISTSGTSANCIRAAKAARTQGMKVVTLTGRNDSELGRLADTDICTPAPTQWADRIQELHIKCIHILIELCEHQMDDLDER